MKGFECNMKICFVFSNIFIFNKLEVLSFSSKGISIGLHKNIHMKDKMAKNKSHCCDEKVSLDHKYMSKHSYRKCHYRRGKIR